jgi:hypothetical protein
LIFGQLWCSFLREASLHAMLNLFVRKVLMLLISLVRRRSHRGWWAYLILLLFYIFMASWFACDLNLSSSSLWPLLIPVIIITAQLIWPTVLGWAIIITPVFLYFCNGALEAIKDSFSSDPLWKWNPGGFVVMLIVLAVLFGVCLALAFALMVSIKPKRMTNPSPEPN